MESDFAAIVTPALPLAFRDVLRVEVDDITTADERAQREVNVSGPAAFVIMKAHALWLRGENKDAYDLVYMLRSYGSDPIADVADRFAIIMDAPEALAALVFLAEDFETEEHLGPRRYAEFLGDAGHAERRAEAFGAVREFLRRAGS